jgi:RNA polymerase sigma-70 factor (ECF subfamily)
MTEPESDHDLVERWRKGDGDAAKLLFNRYSERLVELARHRIGQRLARRVDPEDVVQSVFRTFFKRAKDGRFSIEDPDDLAKLLVKITVHKTLRQVNHNKAAKRDLTLEASGGGDENQEMLAQVLNREPTPDAINTFLDQLEHVFGQLDDQEKQILELRLENYSTEEIAKKLGTYDRKIRRVMERIRKVAEGVLERESDDDDDDDEE